MSKLLAGIPLRPLILHVDINRTIIQTDAAGGKTLEKVLASNVSAASYGRVLDKKFEPVHGPEEPQREAALVSYSDFVDTILFPTPEMAALAPSERRAKMKELRTFRQPAYYAFAAEGGLGAQYQWAIDKQLQALQRPSGTGAFNIIPSFFQLVNVLSELNWPFTLFFRTFGSDLPEILHEWRDFVFSELEVKPAGPVLARMRESWVPPVTGAVYRDDSGVYLTWGVAHAPQPPPDGEFGLSYLHTQPEFASAAAVKDEALLGHMLAAAEGSHGVAGFVDYFPYWASHAEKKHAGKLGPTDDANYHVFFDDNIFLFDEDDSSIFDFRMPNGAPMEDSIAARYAVKVEPYSAITDVNYFVAALAERLHQQHTS